MNENERLVLEAVYELAGKQKNIHVENAALIKHLGVTQEFINSVTPSLSRMGLIYPLTGMCTLTDAGLRMLQQHGS